MTGFRFNRVLPWIATAALALAVTMQTADAKQNVTPKFDGSYAGSADVNTALSKGTCKAIDKLTAEVKKGHLHGLSGNGDKFSAIVTAQGFFTGRYHFKQAKKSTAFEGNAHDGSLTGGLWSLDGNCVWLVSLAKS